MQNLSQKNILTTENTEGTEVAPCGAEALERTPRSA